MPEIAPKLSKQHAVPQHIAAFEFKLIGDLTIKQFLFAGVGIAVAYAAWISDLNFLIKWSTIILAAGLGLGTAFFPIQDRTLDQWLFNFILAIFSPTQRVWRKEPLPPEYLREDYSQFLTSQVLSLTPLQSRRKLLQYLKGFEEKIPKSELAEQEFIEKLNFDLPLPPGIEVAREPEIKPPVESKKEKLPERKELPTVPKLASEINIALEPTYKVPTEKETKYVTTLRNITPGRKVRLPRPDSAGLTMIEGTIQLKPKPPEIAPPTRPIKHERWDVASLPERKLPPPTVKELVKEVKKEKAVLPQVGVLERQNRELKARLEQAELQLKGLMELKQELYSKNEAYRQRLLEQERFVQKLTARQQAAQKEISKIKGVEEKEEKPTVPERKIPNIVSGVVRDKEGKLLENVVVIIKDQDGDPIRALKTNRLGRFAISAPLENGEYTVEVSSRERYFDIMKVTTDGSVLLALEFREKHG